MCETNLPICEEKADVPEIINLTDILVPPPENVYAEEVLRTRCLETNLSVRQVYGSHRTVELTIRLISKGVRSTTRTPGI